MYFIEIGNQIINKGTYINFKSDITYDLKSIKSIWNLHLY